jgi:hypothetical protein
MVKGPLIDIRHAPFAIRWSMVDADSRLGTGNGQRAAYFALATNPGIGASALR